MFFVLIVALPMVAITVLVVSVTNDSRTGKADARVGGALVTARGFYADDLQASRQAARVIAADPRLGVAIRSGSEDRLKALAGSLLTEQGVDSLVIRGADGKLLASVGSDPVAEGTVQLQNQIGSRLGEVSASTTTTHDFLRQVHQGTGLDAALSGSGVPVTSTVDLGNQQLPGPGTASDVTIGSNDQRAATRVLPGGTGLRLTMFGPIGPKGFFSKQPLVLLALAIFFVAAVLFALAILRAVSTQVRTMLAAARRIGDGDFTGEVPVVGRDEMAGLAREFNRMRERLAGQVSQLRKQRDEIETATHRIGEAFAAGLDRQALLEIVLETSLSACRADYGMIALGGASGGEVERGAPTSELRDAILAGEERSTREGRLLETKHGGIVVLSSPLGVAGEPARRGGVMSIARAGEPFDASERDIFGYLLNQISVSIENVSLHELVSQQAVTDDLTGLSNTRRFRDLLGKEAARAKRFGHELSLLLLDLDDFKQINDAYGHLQGDEVLRRVARIARRRVARIRRAVPLGRRGVCDRSSRDRRDRSPRRGGARQGSHRGAGGRTRRGDRHAQRDGVGGCRHDEGGRRGRRCADRGGRCRPLSSKGGRQESRRGDEPGFPLLVPDEMLIRRNPCGIGTSVGSPPLGR